jgi:hypothetical protein
MEQNPIKLARRYWRFFAPTWLMPGLFMLLIIAQDISGTDFLSSSWTPLIAVPFMLAGMLGAGYLQRRERLPWGVFYIIWLAPMMAVWIFLVLVRAAILIALGRSL